MTMQRSRAARQELLPLLVRSRSCSFATTALAAMRRSKTEPAAMKRAPRQVGCAPAPATTVPLPPLWVAGQDDNNDEDEMVVANGKDDYHDGARVARWMNEGWAELRAEGERQRGIRDKADREVRAALARVRDLQAQRQRGRTNKAGLPTLD